jgi:nucleotide sugar dehydrogenase
MRPMSRDEQAFLASLIWKHVDELEQALVQSTHREGPLTELEVRLIVAAASARLAPIDHAIARPGSLAQRLADRARRLRESAGAVLRPRIGLLHHYAGRPVLLPQRYFATPLPASPPRVSLVTPSYQQGAFLERTISSVLAQGYPALEYVVRDGGSTDGSCEILERYADKLTTWSSEPDGGQADAINRAFAATSGEIMGWLNSDDILLPGALAYVADYFARHPDVDVLYGNRVLIDSEDREVGLWILPRHDPNVLKLADYIPQETLFWRRRIWDSAGGHVDPSFKYALDWDLLLRFQEAGARMVHVPRFLGAFRVHADQKTVADRTIGLEEMSRLRERVHGRPVDLTEVLQGLRPYFVRHRVIHGLHRVVDWMPRRVQPFDVAQLPRAADAGVGTPQSGASADATVPHEHDIAVLGLWHLGAVSVAGWCALGMRVAAWDSDPRLRSNLAGGRAPVIEDGVEDAYAQATREDRLEILADAADAVAGAPVTHLTYDTKVAEADLLDLRLEEAVEVFSLHAPDGALLLVSSQLPVGTCNRWLARLEDEGRGLGLAHIPENLRLGRALPDFLHPPRLVLGAEDDPTYERAAALLRPLGSKPIRTRLASAEMAKHATNAYLALCIAFANDLASIALERGADPAEVSEALRADPRVSPKAPLRPGTAFSGETLGRDVRILAWADRESGRPSLFQAVLDSNERHSYVGLAWLEQEISAIAGAELAVAGLTYKPGTSTLRDSLPLRIVKELVARGAHVRAWDPLAEEFEPEGFVRERSLDVAVAGADALLVLTSLPELREVQWESLAPRRRLVIDAALGVNASAARAAGWTYRGLAAA